MPLLSMTQTPLIQTKKKSYDGKGNYSAFMAIAPVQSSDDLSLLVGELKE